MFDRVFNLIIISLLVFSSPVMAKAESTPDAARTIYRWTDGVGQVHFGDVSGLHIQQQHPDDADILQLQTNIIKSVPASDLIHPEREAGQQRDLKWKYRRQPVSPDVRKLERCHKAEEQLREIRAILRSGYKASRYNRLHKRELAAMHKRSEYCQD
ncbi:MAG: DUF4124 domain-containing protein [Gammaproteobacteria bacterium]